MTFAQLVRVNDLYCLQLKIESNAKPIHRTLVLTLDYSGSMNGNPLNAGRSAMAAVLRNAVNDFDDIVLIMYNHEATVFIVNKSNVEEIAYKVENWYANGATNFTNVFNNIIQILRDRQNLYKNAVDLRVSFFTDGKHFAGNTSSFNSTRAECERLNEISLLGMYQALTNLKSALKNPDIISAGGNTTVVARGFGAGNDLDLLNKISDAGITRGNYRYASTADEINNILTSDSVLIGERINANIRILDNGNIHTERMYLSEIDQNEENIYTHEGEIFIKLSNLCKSKVIIEINGQIHELLKETKPPTVDFVDIAMRYCSNEILKVSQEFVKMNANQTIVKTSVDQLNMLDKYLDTISNIIRRIKIRTLRRSLYQILSDMKTKIYEMNSAVADISRNGYNNNDRMSKLLSNSYDILSITKIGFRNRLNKRVNKNIGVLAEEDSKIEALSKIFDESKFGHLNDIALSCHITLASWVDLCNNSDMLCITGFMERHENAIADPSRIKFKKVFPVLMSFSSFQDELLVQLSRNIRQEDQVHGGFGFNFQTKTGVLSAFGDKKINFVYPLYICKEHWNIAQHLIKRNLGWMATLDWAGSDFQQLKVIPFTLMNNSIKSFCTRGVNEATIQKFFNIARVAKQLIIDFNMKTVNEDFDNWVKSPLYRTGNDIKDINVFLIKLLFMSVRPHLDNSFWLSVIEELSRRSLLQSVRNDDELVYDVNALASAHDYKKYVSVTEKKESSISSYRLSMLIYMNDTKVENNTNVEDESKENSLFNSTEYDLTENMMKPVKANELKIQSSLEFLLAIKKMYDYFENAPVTLDYLYGKLDDNYGIITEEHVNVFSKLDIKSVKQSYYNVGEIFGASDKHMYAMFLQNNFQPHHAKRRKAVENGTYVMPFNDESHVLVQTMVDTAIQSEKISQMTLLQSNINEKYGIVFRNTDDILTAAGIIYTKCKNMGDQSFVHLYTQLKDRNYNTPLFIEKVRLLVEGEYNGFRLYRDSGRFHNATTNPYKWPVSHKNMYNIMQAYQAIVERRGDEYTMCKDDWLHIFQWKSETHGRTTKRNRGELPVNKNSKKKRRMN
jgi:hypothetical protein